MPIQNPLGLLLKSRPRRGLADFTPGAKGPNDPRSYRASQQAGAPQTPGDGLGLDTKGALEFTPGPSSLLEAVQAAGESEGPEAAAEIALKGPLPRAIVRDATALTISNTAAETTYFTSIVPEKLLIDSRCLRLRLLGEMLNNTLMAQTFVFRVKLGGTTLYDDTFDPLGVGLVISATPRLLHIEGEIAALGSASSQMLWGRVWVTNVSATTTGLGDMGPGNFYDVQYGSNGPSSINMDIAQTLEVTIQPSAASASYTFTRRHSLLEVY